MDDLLNPQKLNYTGKIQPQPDEINPQTGQRYLPYLPDEELVQVVNWAIKLNRPLLLKGEPGCGKTQLASAVAYELKLPFEAWYIKSTSSAQDGLYTYDNVARLRDAQLAALGQLPNQADKKEIEDPGKYVKFGALGRAFQNTKRTVVLIDEIDKADLDFPNDLLLELDEKRLVVQDVDIHHPLRQIRAKASPLVFITSNDEKDLPDAFLRRCLFHYVKFPSERRLRKILEAHFTGADEAVIKQAITRFIQLRKQMELDKVKTRKKVSTSELLDWFALVSDEPTGAILSQLKSGELPFAGVLLKNHQDYERYGMKA